MRRMDDSPVTALLERYLESWNARDADAMAETLAEDAVLVGFDGSVMKGREDARQTLRKIFTDHPTGRYVWLVRGRGAGEEPEEVLLRDLPLLVSIVAWASACGAILLATT